MTAADAEPTPRDALRKALLAEPPAVLERLAAALVGRLLDVRIDVAQAGSQVGGDGGAGRDQPRRLRIESKRYGDGSTLSIRELLGELEQAVTHDPVLEAWVLVATQEIPEQVVDAVTAYGQRHGVAVVPLGWAHLAALCSAMPDLVESIVTPAAGAQARGLAGSHDSLVGQLRRALQTWAIGFQEVRNAALCQLAAIWQEPRRSAAQLGQNAAGGAVDRRIRRRHVHDALDGWWEKAATRDAPAVLAGWGGVGKTWAALDWLTARVDAHPIVLVIPASSVSGLGAPTEMGVRQFLAERLHELTRVRDGDYWQARLGRLLQRPDDEGPLLTVFMDGFNQEAGAPWLALLKVLQAPPFAGRVRVLASVRTSYLDMRLGGLRGLVEPAVRIDVGPYDLEPGGEFDAMLAHHNLTRDELHPDLVALARVPRLFDLVIRLRDRLVRSGNVTVHGLLWEYGRDTLGVRAGRSFSEADWRAWLAEVAQDHLNGLRDYSLKAFGATAARADLDAEAVEARLSDVIDGGFAIVEDGRVRLEPHVVAQALGSALLRDLRDPGAASAGALGARLDDWLDPIAGLDERAEILSAAVSILALRDDLRFSTAAEVIVTAWLQSQNLSGRHRAEVLGLASHLIGPLLHCVEASRDASQSGARRLATVALSGVDRSDLAALRFLAERLRRWVSIVSRGTRQDRLDGRLADQRRTWFETLVGFDESRSATILGVDLTFVDDDDGELAALAAALLQGFPLAPAIAVFEAYAVARTLDQSDESWRAFTWLCTLNESDAEAAAAALRGAAERLQARPPEPGVHPELPRRAAAVLLWLTERDEDERLASVTNPPFYRRTNYQDYLKDPANSFFPLERRHAAQVLSDTGAPLLRRVKRLGDLWLDPHFEPPASFIAEMRAFADAYDPSGLQCHSAHTAEDHNWELLAPAVARCAPDRLARIGRSQLYALGGLPPESRYWAGIGAPQHFLLTDDKAAAAAGALRRQDAEADGGNEMYVRSRLLMVEIAHLDGGAQTVALLDADLRYISTEFEAVLQPLDAPAVDALIQRYVGASDPVQDNLLILLSMQATGLSEAGWGWALERLQTGKDGVAGCAMQMLYRLDGKRLGAHLLDSGWRWCDRPGVFTGHYGSMALAEGSRSVPFEQILDRLAPWRLLDAVRRRGGVREEAQLAAQVLDEIVSNPHADAPDAGAALVVRSDGEGPLTVSVETADEPSGDPVADLQRAFDSRGRLERTRAAARTAAARIREARDRGAKLHLVDVTVEDLRLLFENRPDIVDRWLDGYAGPTPDFRKRVRLAEPLFLRLCELFLELDPGRGAALWTSLRSVLHTSYRGLGDLDERLHMLFRAPPSDAVDALLGRQVELDLCKTDAELAAISLAAQINGRGAWLDDLIGDDAASAHVWRRRRAMVLSGFRTGRELPILAAWPEGEILTTEARLAWASGQRQFLDAAARHWWRCFLEADDPQAAYAAWTLFFAAAGPGAWAWMRAEADAHADKPLVELKAAHAELNRSALKRRIEDRRDKFHPHFLRERVSAALWPWRDSATPDNA